MRTRPPASVYFIALRTRFRRIALNGSAGWNHIKPDSFLQGLKLVLVGNLLKQVHEVQWRWLNALRVPETKCRKKLVELSGQPVDCMLTGSQQTKLGFCSNSETKQLMRALERLERLA